MGSLSRIQSYAGLSTINDCNNENENNLIIDAKVSISDLNKEIGSSIQINGYDTIGGLVYKELGKMPVVGDTVNFNDLEIVIQSTVGRRIGRLRVRIL